MIPYFNDNVNCNVLIYLLLYSLGPDNLFYRKMKLSTIVFCFFVDPEVLQPANLETLYEMKQYQKLYQKQEKELEVMRKKHEKVSTSVWNASSVHLGYIKSTRTMSEVPLGVGEVQGGILCCIIPCMYCRYVDRYE